ncbi:putative ribonuclease H-like domain-containing protein [Tanacetum coccineum]
MELNEHVPVYVSEQSTRSNACTINSTFKPKDGEEDDDEDPEEDPSEEHEPEDDDDDDDTDDEDEEPTEEEEHLAPADSFVVPVDLVPSAGDTEAFETDESAPTPRSPQTRVPFSQTHLCRAQKTVRLEPPMSASMKARIAEHAAASIPPTNPTYDQAPLGHRAAMIRMRDDILEEDMPPRRRFVLTASPPRCDIAESSAAAAARAPRPADRAEELAQVHKKESEDFYTRLFDARTDHRDIRLEIDVVRGQRTAYETEFRGNARLPKLRGAKQRALLAQNLRHPGDLHESMELAAPRAEDVCAVRYISVPKCLQTRARIDTVEDASSSYTECVVLSPDFKLLNENHVLLRAPRKDNMYSIDLKNIVPSGGLTCLFAKATLDESYLWHRRLGHINFKTMNKLVRENLVRGLSSKIFENNHTCIACQKGKQHKTSCKTKIVSSISQPLQMLHMDLFGPTFVKSLMKRMYCLVVTNDYSRFSWVFFLATKDETSEILKTFITSIENIIDLKVKVIRCDNGTEFKNKVMNQFCEMKGIKREFSVARTPQQNRVAERKNRTLIEAARTMLADLKLPTTFWAEAVNTACYVQNRVLVIKPHNKTPYELFLGRKPALSFMRPFGCPVTILNTIDHLGKFDGKADEGFFIGYSTNSKAFRVFNSRTRIVEENLHVKFSEDTPNIAGSGPNWLFDIDALTKSMNYEPVVAGNQSNGSVDPSFSSNSKYSPDAGFKPLGEEEKMDAKHPENENKNNAVDENIVYGCDDDPNMTNSEEIVYSDDDERVDAKANMTNLDSHILVSPTPKLQKNKKDERGIVIKNRDRLVAQRYTQEEGIDYDEVFALVARIKAIRLFLAYASVAINGFDMPLPVAVCSGLVNPLAPRKAELTSMSLDSSSSYHIRLSCDWGYFVFFHGLVPLAFGFFLVSKNFLFFDSYDPTIPSLCKIFSLKFHFQACSLTTLQLLQAFALINPNLPLYNAEPSNVS